MRFCAHMIMNTVLSKQTIALSGGYNLIHPGHIRLIHAYFRILEITEPIDAFVASIAVATGSSSVCKNATDEFGGKNVCEF